jgi:hypothetical protein
MATPGLPEMRRFLPMAWRAGALLGGVEDEAAFGPGRRQLSLVAKGGWVCRRGEYGWRCGGDLSFRLLGLERKRVDGESGGGMGHTDRVLRIVVGGRGVCFVRDSVHILGGDPRWQRS